MIALAMLLVSTPVEWEIDSGHSSVSFTIKHLGLSKVRGELKDFQGVVKADVETGKLDNVEASVKVASINTNNADRDDHLKTDDFFNAEKYPLMKLKTKKITYDGMSFTAETELTIRDVTKTVIFKGEQEPVRKLTFGKTQRLVTAVTATTKINRKDFGLKWNKAIEAVQVAGDEVTVELNVELGRKA